MEIKRSYKIRSEKRSRRIRGEKKDQRKGDNNKTKALENKKHKKK